MLSKVQVDYVFFALVLNHVVSGWGLRSQTTTKLPPLLIYPPLEKSCGRPGYLMRQI